MPQIPSATNRERYANNRFTLSYTVQLSAAEGACCIIRVETPINRERTPSSFYASRPPALSHEHQLEGLPEPSVLSRDDGAVAGLSLDPRLDHI